MGSGEEIIMKQLNKLMEGKFTLPVRIVLPVVSEPRPCKIDYHCQRPCELQWNLCLFSHIRF